MCFSPSIMRHMYPPLSFSAFDPGPPPPVNYEDDGLGIRT